MNALWLLMGLLLLSYIGSFLVGGRAIRGFGLPSGAEFVVLGFVFGPEALGVFERQMLESFRPVAEVALGWLVFVLGLTYGFDGKRRTPPGRLLVGNLCAMATGATVGAAAWFFLVWKAPSLSHTDRLLVAVGTGTVGSETTRYAVRWVVERYLAKGPVSELVADLADSDDLVPLLVVGVLFGLAPASTAVALPVWAWSSLTLGLGVVLGLFAALLLGRTFQLGETWSVLMGMSLLAIGTAARFGLSTIAATFMMGFALSLASPHRREIAAMVAPTERAVMLPALVLAGAHLDFASTRYLPWLIAACVLARVVAKSVIGVLILGGVRAARPAGPLLGFGLLSSGALAMAIGLAFSLRFPGTVGDLVLATAAVITVFGEFTGPAALRTVLRRAGEIDVQKESDAEKPAVADTGEAAV